MEGLGREGEGQGGKEWAREGKEGKKVPRRERRGHVGKGRGRKGGKKSGSL